MGKRFQTKTVSYKDIYRMAISDRVSLARSQQGSNILSALTPEQYASLFPKYYQRNLPDIGGFLKAMSPEGRSRLRNVTPGSSATDGWRSETQRRRDTLDRALPLRRETAVSPALRRLEQASGIRISDPKAKAQLTDQQKEVFGLLKKGQLPADDPRLDFINKLSEEDRRQAGIETVSGEDGKQSFRMLPTAAETVPREDVERDLRKSSEEGFSPRERATLDFIARREGSKDPNVIFGDLGSIGGTGRYSKELGLDKRPLTDHSIAEVLSLQPKLTRLTREQGVGVINGTARGTSAVGSGQMIRSTLLANLKALGIPESEWGNIKFDKNLQERLTLMNFKTSGIGDPNADPSTWNLRILGDQYESLNPNRIGSKGNLRPGELDSIRNASSIKQHTGPIDSATIDAEIERRKNQEYEERQSRLAERTIPQLPPNIDPNFIETYSRLSPGQKQRVHQAINALGEGQTGIDRFNELYKKDPSRTTDNVLQGESRVVELQREVASVRRGDLQQNLRNQLEYAAAQAGVNVEVYSGGQARAGTPGAPRIGSTRHDEGGAADIRLSVRDDQGRKRLLDMTNENDRAIMERFVSNAVKAGATGVGAGVGYMGKHGIHVGGGSSTSWGGSDWIERARVAGESQRENFSLNEWIENRNAKKEEPNLVRQESEQNKSDRLQAAAAAGDRSIFGLKRAIYAEAPVANTIPVYADGGTIKSEDNKITAYPISDLKGDNSVVVDSNKKPLFTMNTQRESANFDPNTGNVTVNPESVTRNNPDSLNPPVKNDTQQEEPQQPGVTQMSRDRQPVSQNQSVGNDDMRENIIRSTMNPFTCPSFTRAISESNFKRTSSDGVGVGHFDHNNYSLK
jgi:hypothetical protein